MSSVLVHWISTCILYLYLPNLTWINNFVLLLYKVITLIYWNGLFSFSLYTISAFVLIPYNPNIFLCLGFFLICLWFYTINAHCFPFPKYLPHYFGASFFSILQIFHFRSLWFILTHTLYNLVYISGWWIVCLYFFENVYFADFIYLEEKAQAGWRAEPEGESSSPLNMEPNAI